MLIIKLETTKLMIYPEDGFNFNVYGPHKVVDVDMLTNIITKMVKVRDQGTEAVKTASGAKISKSILLEAKLTCNDCNTGNHGVFFVATWPYTGHHDKYIAKVLNGIHSTMESIIM